jgi:hypothetical protein
MHQELLHVVQKSARTIRLWCGTIKNQKSIFFAWREHIGFLSDPDLEGIR